LDLDFELDFPFDDVFFVEGFSDPFAGDFSGDFFFGDGAGTTISSSSGSIEMLLQLSSTCSF
jgi:hypothetical protein